MNLNPELTTADRIGSVVIGAAAVAYAFLGGSEQVWVRGVLVAVGVAIACGGSAGT